MKNYLATAIMSTYILASCSFARSSATSICDENNEFRLIFFRNVSLVETYSQERLKGAENYTVTPDEFMTSLNFISSYTKVSMGDVLNYDVGYPNYDIFLKDKSKWIKWYDANKCHHITIK